MPVFKELLRTRQQEATRRDMPPYLIASEQLLAAIARALPINPEKLALVEGMSEQKLKDYGELFCSVVRKYCTDSPGKPSILTNSELSAATLPENASVSTPQVTRMKPAVSSAYQLFQHDKQSISSIATARAIQEQTVKGYLATALESGHKLDFNRMEISPEVLHWGENAIVSGEDVATAMATTANSFQTQASYSDLRAARIMAMYPALNSEEFTEDAPTIVAEKRKLPWADAELQRETKRRKLSFSSECDATACQPAQPGQNQIVSICNSEDFERAIKFFHAARHGDCNPTMSST